MFLVVRHRGQGQNQGQQRKLQHASHAAPAQKQRGQVEDVVAAGGPPNRARGEIRCNEGQADIHRRPDGRRDRTGQEAQRRQHDDGMRRVVDARPGTGIHVDTADEPVRPPPAHHLERHRRRWSSGDRQAGNNVDSGERKPQHELSTAVLRGFFNHLMRRSSLVVGRPRYTPRVTALGRLGNPLTPHKIIATRDRSRLQRRAGM